MRTIRKVVTFLTCFGLGFGVSSAFALSQDGRVTGSFAVNGSAVNITGNSFGGQVGQCVLYSHLIYDATAPRQVEAGVVRCNNAAIDGTCNGGFGFTERFDGSGYYCNQGNGFTNNVSYDTVISRDNSTQYSGGILGSSNVQSGFDASHHIYAYAWAEVTGAGGCPGGNHAGSFSGWQRLTTSWGTVTGSNILHGGASGPCWTVSGISGGSFNVS